ncbi:hypothetical protein ACFY5F_26320 [Streptomyces sp. NPDC013161]|uniref:hypothetical protein n=1 Tax=Streptomyces sp. NPDC013161 TaxID=3364862 RepID=UPI0036B88CA5
MNLSLGVRVLVVVICALVSVIVALVGGFLSHAPGGRKAAAVLFGGGVFGGCMILCMTVLNAVGVL